VPSTSTRLVKNSRWLRAPDRICQFYNEHPNDLEDEKRLRWSRGVEGQRTEFSWHEEAGRIVSFFTGGSRGEFPDPRELARTALEMAAEKATEAVGCPRRTERSGRGSVG